MAGTCDPHANTNKIGPTVNWLLPNAEAENLTLILDTGDEAASEYTLCYRPDEGIIQPRQLNV